MGLEKREGLLVEIHGIDGCGYTRGLAILLLGTTAGVLTPDAERWPRPPWGGGSEEDSI